MSWIKNAPDQKKTDFRKKRMGFNTMQKITWPKIDYLVFSPEPVVGVDEAGRGCLAGPVFAGAVILNFPQKFTDSKLLNSQQREKFAQHIYHHHKFSIGIASPREIEELNIHNASLLAMKRAVRKLQLKTGHLLIDGKFTIKGLRHLSQTAIIKGDQRVDPISAAGIIAKIKRDTLFSKYHRQYPEYDFKNHKGYATKNHKEAIKRYGPCPLHRKNFSGVKEYI